jgi:cytochrome c peroxidase
LDAYLPVPESNPISREKVELGKKLFFDKRLSLDRSISCATCHDPARAFSDGHATAVGIRGQKGERRTPRIANRVYGKSFFWDGRAKTLEEQVLQPIENPKEMAVSAAEAGARVGLDVPTMQNALATYVRTILSGNSAYDRYVLNGEASLSDQQKAGLRLFRGKAGCSACHLGPNFTDEKLHNTGAGASASAFKTPSLRDVARTPPYMHDGSLSTLDEVIEFYDQGGKKNSNLDADIRPLNLTGEEKKALATFLEALNGVIREGM